MLEKLHDFANEVRELRGYEFNAILIPSKMKQEFEIDKLDWDSIQFGIKTEIERIPNDRRGIYAFTIQIESEALPPHAYIVYIGIAGKQSEVSLRKRYRQYLSESYLIKERPKLADAFGNWREVIRFYFAPVEEDFTSDQLETLEEQINEALVPPCSVGDFEADMRKKLKALRR